MKETYYFSHDYHARHDIKMETLSMEQIGIYWCLIEMLYEENGYISLSLCERIANALRTQCDTILSVIRDYQLFENDGKQFWSNSVLKRLKFREEKSNKARISAQKRWGGCERIAIKERKGKERKEKEISTIVDTANAEKVKFGNEDINWLIGEFETIMGFKSAGGKKDRIMAKHLLNNFSKEQLTAMLKYLATQEYAPRVGSVEKLWYKRGDIIAGIKSINNKNKITIV